jgi:hypothetical protein
MPCHAVSRRSSPQRCPQPPSPPSGCSQDPSIAVYPTADLRPPGLLAAGPSAPGKSAVRFDEAVTPVAGQHRRRAAGSLELQRRGQETSSSISLGSVAGRRLRPRRRGR